MAQEKIIELLDELRKDPKAQEALEKIKESKGAEEVTAILAALAKERGFEISEKDFAEAIKGAMEQRKAQTEEAAAQIERLSDDDVAQASGGKKDHAECKDTFKDAENCWFNDGCDHVNQIYSNYICRNNSNGHQCGFFGQSCDVVFWCDKISIGPDDVNKCVSYYESCVADVF